MKMSKALNPLVLWLPFRALPTEVGVHCCSKSFKFSNLGLYLTTRNRHTIIRNYFSDKLKMYPKPATYKFILTIPIRPLSH
ncbi:MAG: hypothetical protein QXF43_05400 [Nitrososphaerales archaeon]